MGLASISVVAVSKPEWLGSYSLDSIWSFEFFVLACPVTMAAEDHPKGRMYVGMV